MKYINKTIHPLAVLFVILFSLSVSAQQINWQQTSGPYGGPADHVFMNSPSKLIAAGGPNIHMSTDNGATWSKINYNLPVTNISTLDVNSAGDIFVGSYMAQIYRLDNNTTSWQLANNGIEISDIISFAVDSTGNLYAGTFSKLWRSIDNGANWTELTFVTGMPIASVNVLYVGSGNFLFAANYDGIYYSDDIGASWTELATGISVNAILEDGTGAIHIGSWDGLRSAPDLGGNFTLNTSLPPDADILSLETSSSGNLYAGTRGGFFVSTNGGSTWSPAVNGLAAKDVVSLDIRSDNTIIAGTELGPFLTSNDGANWTRSTNGYINTGINVIAEHINGDFFAGGDNGLYQSTDNGETWNTIAHFDTMIVKDVLHDTSGLLFVGTDMHGVWRSPDNGVSWDSVNTGISSRNVIAMGINSLNQLFITNYNGVFRSTDSGDNWTNVYSGGYEAVEILADENDILYIATFDGVYRSTNNGLNWTGASTALININRFAHRQDGYLYAGTANGIYRSDDQGTSWTNITAGLTNPNVHSILVTRKGHIFVGTDSGRVFLSTNLGDSWTLENSGLPNSMVHALAINDNSNLLTGTKGDGVFSTIYDNSVFSVNPPSILDFGNASVQVGRTDSVEITNISYIGYDVVSVSISGTDTDDFTTASSGFTINPGETGYIVIDFVPLDSGVKSAFLDVETTGGPFQVELSGTGTAPIMNVDITSLAFDSTRTNTTSIDSVLITNLGTDNLNITQAFITGTNAAQFSVTTPSSSVPPANSIWLPVYFVPADTGNFSATLNLLSDGGAGQVALTGIGVASIMSVSTNTLNFGNVNILSPISLDITVENTGNALLNVSEIFATGTDASFFTASPQTFTLQPGASRVVAVTFSPDQVRAFTATLAIFSDAGEENIALTGNGTNVELAVTPDSLHVGDSTVGATISDTLYLSNTGSATMNVSALNLSGTNVSAFTIPQSTPFTISGGATFALGVNFTPQLAGFHTASLFIESDGGSWDIPLTGSGTEAIMNISSRSITFPETNVNTTRTSNFTIVNEGNAELVVSEYFLSGAHNSEFQIPSSPINLQPLASVNITVTFAPLTVGGKTAEIIFFSNASTSPDTVSLTGTAINAANQPQFAANPNGIVFTDTQIGNASSVPFYIKNTGNTVLNISEYFLVGSFTSEYQVTGSLYSIQPADSALFTASFLPTSIGSKPGAIVFITNAITSPDSVYLAANAIETANTITVSEIQQPVAGNDLTINIQLESTFNASSQTLYYRNIGKLNYNSAPLDGSGTEYSATIPQSAVQLRGLEYYIVLSDAQNTVTYPQTNPATNPVRQSVMVNSHTPPLRLNKESYQMISFPCDVYDMPLNQIFTDDYGEYDKSNWRLLYYYPYSDSLLYLEYPFHEEFFIYPGMAFWLITKNGTLFDVDSASTLMSEGPYIMSLMPGWNMIGNPFDFPISTDDIETLDSIEDPVSYNGTNYEYNQLILQPWEGYFVYNPEPTYVQAIIPPIEAGELPKSNDPMLALGQNEMTLQFSASIKNSNAKDVQNYLGFRIDAEQGRDSYDFSEAPPITDDIQVYINDNEWSWAGNFKPVNNEGQQWELVLKAKNKKSITMKWQQSGTLPDDQKLYIFDQTTQAPLRAENGSYTLSSGLNGERRFKVIIGTENYALDNSDGIPLVPVDYALGQNYPNPFNPTTAIPFQLAKKSHVQIEIFNILGHKVKTLCNNTLTTGSHSVTWDGSNNNGNSVAAGVYFYRMQAGPFQAVNKLVLVR